METVPQSVFSFTDVHVEQENVPEAGRKKSATYLSIKFDFSRAICNRLSPAAQCEYESSRNLFRVHYVVDLRLIKKKGSSFRRSFRKFFAGRFAARDGLINIPKKVQDKAVRMLFQALDKAVNPALPIKLEIWEITVRTRGANQSRINATRPSIEGLERLRLQVLGSESCPICLEDYDQSFVFVTRLPCSHYFHGDCIALWLHTQHICPLCRFAVPTTPQQRKEVGRAD